MSTRITIVTDMANVIASVEVRADDGTVECVRATGESLSQAVENLITRFKDLQEVVIEELYNRGFIRVMPREAEGPMS